MMKPDPSQLPPPKRTPDSWWDETPLEKKMRWLGVVVVVAITLTVVSVCAAVVVAAWRWIL